MILKHVRELDPKGLLKLVNLKPISTYYEDQRRKDSGAVVGTSEQLKRVTFA